MRVHLGCCALFVAIVAAGCGRATVTRVVDGRAIEGRPISEYAYALYAQGAQAEAHGDYVTAARAFEVAALEDGPNADVWTRVGAARCHLGDGAGAADAFERAMQVDATFEPLHRERARCALRAGRVDEALREAQAALALDPDRAEASLVLAEALERAGHAEEALRALHALTIREPGSPAGLRALAASARRAGATALAADAEDRLGRLDATDGTNTDARAGAPVLADVDTAFVRGDTREAARLARRLHLSSTEVAVRAAALGRMAFARARASEIAGADPTDASARIALAVSADALGDAATVEAALASATALARPPSLLAQLLFAELLDRRVGRDAARVYLGAAVAPTTGDELVTRTARRVFARVTR